MQLKCKKKKIRALDDAQGWADMNWAQSMLYHIGNNQHTSSVQVNKGIGENEKRVFYFTDRKHTANPTVPIIFVIAKILLKNKTKQYNHTQVVSY